MERQKIHSERMYIFIPSVVVGRSVVVVGMVELCDVVGILIEPSVVVGSDAFVVCSCVNVVVGSVVVVVVGSSVVVVVGISVVVKGSGVVVVGISVVTGVVVGSGVVVVGISVVVVGFCVVVGLGVVVVGVIVVVGVSVVVVVCSTVVVGNVDEVVGSSLSDISKIKGRFNYTHALLLSFCLLAQSQICLMILRV